MFEVINWPADMAPSRSPIHFTNELEVAVPPATIWSLLTDPLFWICTGILFFYLGDFFYNVFYNFLVTQGMDTGRRLFKAINNNLIIVLYSCFIIAFICSHNSRK